MQRLFRFEFGKTAQS